MEATASFTWVAKKGSLFSCMAAPEEKEEDGLQEERQRLLAKQKGLLKALGKALLSDPWGQWASFFAAFLGQPGMQNRIARVL